MASMKKYNIKSSIINAKEAIAELTGVDVSDQKNMLIEFSYSSGIAGMEKGKELTNNMLQAVSNFSEAVLIQANKFPQIAIKIEERDLEQAKRWGN